jgi:ABC-type branched-subunit amino acid transport system substrate-binding protein
MGKSRRRARARARAAIGAALVAGLVAATLVGTGGGAGATRKVRGFDGSTLKLAGIGIGAQFADAGTAAEARIKRFNDTNEIKGVKITWDGFVDDKQDPATALSETRRLVTQDQIFALTADTSQFNPGDYLAQQHVPYFGWAFDATYCSKTPSTKLWGFGYTGCLLNPDPSVLPDSNFLNYKMVSAGTGKKQPTVFLFGNDSESSKIATKNGTVTAAKAGFKVVGSDNTMPLPPVPDYAPYAQKALTSDGGKAPDAMLCLLSTDCIQLDGLVAASGYKGYFISSLYSGLLTKIMSGSYASVFFTAPDQATPAMKQMQADINAVKPGSGNDVSSAQVAGYGSTDMFISALKKVAAKGKSNITPENVQKAASTMTWEIKGLTGPVSYPKSTVVLWPYCNAIVHSDGTAWTQQESYACSKTQYPKK